MPQGYARPIRPGDGNYQRMDSLGRERGSWCHPASLKAAQSVIGPKRELPLSERFQRGEIPVQIFM